MPDLRHAGLLFAIDIAELLASAVQQQASNSSTDQDGGKRRVVTKTSPSTLGQHSREPSLRWRRVNIELVGNQQSGTNKAAHTKCASACAPPFWVIVGGPSCRAFSGQQFCQLRDVGRNPPRLVLREQLGRRSSAGLLLEIDIRQLLPGAVDYDKARL